MMGTPKFSETAMERRSGATMGKSELSAISLMMCTEVTEACNIKDAIDWKTACDFPLLNWVMITAGIVILMVIINALKDIALEAESEQALVKNVPKGKRKSMTTGKDREQNRHKRAALMLTAMLVATTPATSSAEPMNVEMITHTNQPTQAVQGCRDQRSHTAKVEWRQNGHMVMAHATAVSVNQPTNAIGDGHYDPRANVSHRPLEETVRDNFSSMTTPDNALKYLFANVQHIETPTSIQNWQLSTGCSRRRCSDIRRHKARDKQVDEEHVPRIQHVQLCDRQQIDVDGESHK
jgi:hypothetical protein